MRKKPVLWIASFINEGEWQWYLFVSQDDYKIAENHFIEEWKENTGDEQSLKPEEVDCFQIAEVDGYDVKLIKQKVAS